MADDDLDLDLEVEAEAAQPKRRGLFGRRTKAPAAGAEAAPDARGSDAAPAQTGKKKPSFLSRVAPSGETTGGKDSLLNIKNFLIGLVVVIGLLLVIDNWSPARLNLIGLHVDIPKSVLFVVDFALGFGIAWWICRRRGASQTSK